MIKKLFLSFTIALFFASGYAQITKEDAYKLLNQNPIEKVKSVYIWGEYGNTEGKIGLTFSSYKANTCKLEAWDTGFMLTSTVNGIKSQTFMPYLYVSEFYADQERISISLNK